MAREIDKNIVEKLRQFIEDETMSCSMDYGCMTPLYVYRMWGGDTPLNEIEAAFTALNKEY